MRATRNVAALMCMSGIASSLRRAQKKNTNRPADWGVTPEDMNDTHVHCGELRLNVEKQVASGEWPIDDPVVKGAQACVNGMSGQYPCSGIDLLSYMPLSTFGQSEANDIWGWTDPETGKEYAIMGVRAGTVFVDISDPENPQYLVYVRTHTSASTWRDIKVYNNRAYIVSEASGHGMQVYDLTRLRGVTSETEHTPDAHSDYFGNAHNVVINEDTARAYAVGARSYCSGGLVIFDISALQPEFIGCFSADGYTHDAQCVVYSGPDSEHVGKEICAAFNEDSVTIVDVTDAANTVQISRTPYAGSRYTHQGWFDGEQRYIYANDELDEGSSDPKTRTLIFNAEDLDNVQFVEKFYHDTDSIDHNNYFLNGYLYQGNYCAGLRIMKVWPDHLISQAAFFDMEQQCNSPRFEGVWSVFPYFQSGSIAVSSVEKGLFVLKFSADFNGGEPTTTPVPTPAPPPGTWEIASGTGCTKTGNCIQSNNHPASYGNDEACTINAFDVDLTVEAFSTEGGYDYLTMGSEQYAGTSGPPSGTFTGVISWATDSSVVNSGWKLCQGSSPGPEPTPAPTTPTPTTPAPTPAPTTPTPTTPAPTPAPTTPTPTTPAPTPTPPSPPAPTPTEAPSPSICPASSSGPDTDGDCMCDSGLVCYENGAYGCTYSYTEQYGSRSNRWFLPSCSGCECVSS